MEYIYKEIDSRTELYDFYNKIKSEIPYWFDVDYETWCESMFSDTDYDSEKMFHELRTYVAVHKKDMVGFIQFGLPQFVYNEQGEKDYHASAGIIRNLYFDKAHSDCGSEMIHLAMEYFAKHSVDKRYAFFHAFGMTCNAGHGKMFVSQRHIEEVLSASGFIKEHENVYFSHNITKDNIREQDVISVKYEQANKKGLCNFSLYVNGDYVGAGAIVYLPQENLSYLRWIYIEEAHQRKGYATKALHQIFADLYKKGISRMDTDTADGNPVAQKLYRKAGFEDMGRSRSYLI